MALNPIARGKAQCPTWVLQQAVERCFRGSGEIEDGTMRIEDMIDVLATLIDHVSCPGERWILGGLNLGKKRVGEWLMGLELDQGVFVVFPADFGFEKGRRRV